MEKFEPFGVVFDCTMLKHSIAVFTLENSEMSPNVSTVMISFDKCRSVRRCKKLVSTKINRTVNTQTDLIFSVEILPIYT